ncbi:MAG: alpha/beta fold hydrolase [Acidobacteriota bacterium]
MGRIHQLAILTGLLSASWAGVQRSAPVYHDKADLLYYLDPKGRARAVRKASDWEVRRSHILANMQEVMGVLPEPSQEPLDVRFLRTEESSSYRLHKITYVSERWENGPDRVPAWLLVPKQLKPDRTAPAAVCLHQTTKIGKDSPAGLGGPPSLFYAKELAERGFVTVVPDYPNFGEYQVDPYAHGYVSATMKGIVNHRRAVDVLRSRPEVHPERIAAIGHSLGGHNALFLAAFDPRVKAVVTSCGFCSFRKYMKGDLTGWSHKGYMPRIADRYGKDPYQMPFDFTELLGSLAPRAVFVVAPLHDSNFDVEGVRECQRAAGPLYDEVFRTKDRLVFQFPDAEHQFPDPSRKAAYDFLARCLD